MDKTIKESPLFGWRGTSVIAGANFAMAAALFVIGESEGLIFLASAFGWAGWSLQEYEHLNGYVIQKK